MTIGIALLGALMSTRAVDALNGALARQGLPDALALARAAVLRTNCRGGRRARLLADARSPAASASRWRWRARPRWRPPPCSRWRLAAKPALRAA